MRAGDEVGNTESLGLHLLDEGYLALFLLALGSLCPETRVDEFCQLGSLYLVGLDLSLVDLLALSALLGTVVGQDLLQVLPLLPLSIRLFLSLALLLGKPTHSTQHIGIDCYGLCWQFFQQFVDK